MSFIATTTITLLRGTAQDSFGDTVDLDQAVASEVPFSILEVGSAARRPNEGRTDNVRNYMGRCYPSLEIRRDDRVRDERTGQVYTVDEVVTPVNPVGHTFRSIKLRRVT